MIVLVLLLVLSGFAAKLGSAVVSTAATPQFSTPRLLSSAIAPPPTLTATWTPGGSVCQPPAYELLLCCTNLVVPLSQWSIAAAVTNSGWTNFVYIQFLQPAPAPLFFIVDDVYTNL